LIAVVPHLSAEERKLLESLMDNPDPGDSEISEVIGIVDAKGGVGAARERAMELAQRAESQLAAIQPSPAREALRASITYCVERSR
jgi:heptaprenyl diphosphate synthase